APRNVGEDLTKEALVDRLRLGRRRQVEAEQDAEQRHPGNELLVCVGDSGAQSALRVRRSAARLEAEELEEESAYRVVRSRGLVLLADRVEHPEPGRRRERFTNEARLADARRPRDLDDPRRPVTNLVEHVPNGCELALTTDERRLRDPVLAPAGDR